MHLQLCVEVSIMMEGPLHVGLVFTSSATGLRRCVCPLSVVKHTFIWMCLLCCVFVSARGIPLITEAGVGVYLFFIAV